MFTDRRLCVLAVVLSTALALEAATPGQEAYQAGYRAYMAGNWVEAAEKMRRALQEDPREGVQRFKDKGLNKVDYFPHLYLGLALQELGRDSEAIQALRESSRQGVVPASDYTVLLSKHLRELEARLARSPQPSAMPLATPPSPESPPMSGSAADAIVAEAGKRHPIAVSTPVYTPRMGKTAAVPSFSIPALRPTARTPLDRNAVSPDSTQALRDGIRAYFAGSYEKAEARLRPHVGLPPARLFLAYSMAARFLVSGKRDSLLAAEARDHFARAMHEGAHPPAGDVISPAIQQVLSQSGP